jgi:hypothetical protein
MSRTLIVYDDQKQYVEIFNDYGRARADCEFISLELETRYQDCFINKEDIDEDISLWCKLEKIAIQKLYQELTDKAVLEILDDGVAMIEFIMWLKYLLTIDSKHFYIGFY